MDEATVERLLSRDRSALTYAETMQLHAIAQRRVKWFDYVQRRLGLVSLDKVVDWCARPDGQVAPDAARRPAILDALKDSIMLGEFGAGDWPALAYLPKTVPLDRLGNFPLRLSVGQIAYFHANESSLIPDLWALPGACARWMQARGVSLPPWVPAPGPAEPKAAEHPPKKPWNPTEAHGIIYAMMRSGRFPVHPTPDEVTEQLKAHFDHVPRDPVRGIVKKLWPQVKRGPRNPRNLREKGKA